MSAFTALLRGNCHPTSSHSESSSPSPTTFRLHPSSNSSIPAHLQPHSHIPNHNPPCTHHHHSHHHHTPHHIGSSLKPVDEQTNRAVAAKREMIQQAYIERVVTAYTPAEVATIRPISLTFGVGGPTQPHPQSMVPPTSPGGSRLASFPRSSCPFSPQSPLINLNGSPLHPTTSPTIVHHSIAEQHQAATHTPGSSSPPDDLAVKKRRMRSRSFDSVYAPVRLGNASTQRLVPMDALHVIMSFLPNQAMLSSRAVNLTWHMIVADPAVWRLRIANEAISAAIHLYQLEPCLATFGLCRFARYLFTHHEPLCPMCGSISFKWSLSPAVSAPSAPAPLMIKDGTHTPSSTPASPTTPLDGGLQAKDLLQWCSDDEEEPTPLIFEEEPSSVDSEGPSEDTDDENNDDQPGDDDEQIENPAEPHHIGLPSAPMITMSCRCTGCNLTASAPVEKCCRRCGDTSFVATEYVQCRSANGGPVVVRARRTPNFTVCCVCKEVVCKSCRVTCASCGRDVCEESCLSHCMQEDGFHPPRCVLCVGGLHQFLPTDILAARWAGMERDFCDGCVKEGSPAALAQQRALLAQRHVPLHAPRYLSRFPPLRFPMMPAPPRCLKCRSWMPNHVGHGLCAGCWLNQTLAKVLEDEDQYCWLRSSS